jgi:hypothetical protein
MDSDKIDIIKPKRGRRSKKEIEAAKAAAALESDLNIKLQKNANIEINIDYNENCDENNQKVNENEYTDNCVNDENIIIKQPAKKRGRKPKGGKIIQQTLQTIVQKECKPNIILHLKCSLKDLTSDGDHNSNFTSANVDSYNFETNNELNYDLISNSLFSNSSQDKDNFYNTNITPMYALNDSMQNKDHDKFEEDTEVSNISSSVETREIWRKLKILEHNLHINNISDKKSACFWCSYDFDNPPIYIPKHFIKNSYNVYGCFCTPECAVAHLMEENIDSSAKFERYHLINHIYSKIYEYKKNIKPAPNPYYMLDKYYGNLTIQEYRSLLRSERLFLIVDKPLTRILPEFHEDNDEFIINNKIIPSNNYHVKKRLQKKMPQTKNTILNEKFGNQCSSSNS